MLNRPSINLSKPRNRRIISENIRFTRKKPLGPIFSIESISNLLLWLDASEKVYTGGSVRFTASDKASAQIADAAISPANALDPLTSDVFIWGWVYPTSTTGTLYLISKGAGAVATGYSAYIQNGVFYSGLQLGGSHIATTIGNVSVNTWYFFAITVQRSGNVTGYLNSVAGTPTSVASLSASLNSTHAFTLGAFSSGSSWLSGSLAAVGIGFPADASLITQDDINWLYNNKTPRLYHDFSTAQKTKFGLLADRGAFYNLNPSVEPKTGVPIVDQHLGNNLIFTNTELAGNTGFETRTGVTGISFASGDQAHLVGTHAAVGAATNLGTGDFVINVNTLRTSATQQVIASKYQDADNYWLLEFDAAHKLHFEAKAGAAEKIDIQGTTALSSTTTKYHVQVVCDRSAAAGCKIIYNGTDDTSGTPTTSTDSIDNTGDFYVGQLGDGTLYFNGRVAMLGIGKPADVTAAGVVTALGNIDGSSGLGQYYNEQSSADKTAMAWSCFWDGTEKDGTRTDWVGSLQLTEVKTVNMVTNGDFATNDTTGWMNSATYPWDTADASTGACNLVSDGSVPPSFCNLYQVLPLMSGRSYLLSYAATLNSGGSLGCTYANADLGSTSGYSAIYGGSATVTNAALNPTASNGYLNFYHQNTSAANWTIDNVSVTAASIPCHSDADVFGSWVEYKDLNNSYHIETATANVDAGVLSARLQKSGSGNTYLDQLNLLTVGNTYVATVRAKASADGVLLRILNNNTGVFQHTLTTSFATYTTTASVADSMFRLLPPSTSGEVWVDTISVKAFQLNIGNGPGEAVCKDSVGSNDGIPTGYTVAQLRTAFTTDVPAALAGEGSYAMTFDGVNDKITLSSAIAAGTASTFFARVKSALNDELIFGGLAGHYALYVTGGNLIFSTKAGISASVAHVPDGTAWHSYAVTRSGTTVRFFYDGAQIGTDQTLASNDAGPTISIVSGLSINDTYCVTGLMDDLRYYNVALTPTQVAQLYTLNESQEVTGATAVAQWKFNDGPQTTGISDGDPVIGWESRDTNRRYLTQGTASKSPIYKLTAGPGGQPAVLFDGIDDLLTATSAFLTGVEGTVFIVYKPTAVPNTYQTLLASSDTALDTKNLQIIGRGNTANNHAGYSQQNADTVDLLDGDTEIVQDTSYVLTVYSNGTTIYARVNGLAQTLNADTGGNNGDWWDDSADKDNVTLGAVKRTAETNFFAGYISEVVVYDRVLSEGEIVNVEDYLNTKYVVY